MTKSTLKHLTGIKNEILTIKQWQKIFKVSVNDVTHYIYDNEECRRLAKKEYSHVEILPTIAFNTKVQCNGTDFQYKDITIDLKIISANKHRMFFELFDNNGIYSYQKDKDTHIIMGIMNRNNKIYPIPSDCVENIVNHKVDSLLSTDFYSSKNFLVKKDIGKSGKIGFAINPDNLMKYVNYYLTYQCENQNMIYLLTGYNNQIDTSIHYEEAS